MGYRVWAALLGVLLMTAVSPASAASGDNITFAKLVVQLPVGKEYMFIQQGLMCGTRDSLKSDGAPENVSLRGYGPIFIREMSAAFNDPPTSRRNLFDTEQNEAPTTAYSVGALVYDMELKVCGLAYGDTSFGSKGSGHLKVEWQVFSTSTRKVVATIDTSGSFVLKKRDDSGYSAADQIIQGAFAESVRQLAASAEFKALATKPPPGAEIRVDPATQARIALRTGSAKSRPISDVGGAVVLLSLPDSFGSGVLVSSEGYILTNAHVVGNASAVKVRWSDGFETSGEVIRLHKGRDVALVKTDPRGREPLALRTGPVAAGDTVLAIGTPLDKGLQGSVTRGIVSGTGRIMNGYSFIQSDVAVTHGNSGGPLVDEKGAIVGLTDLGFQPTGEQVNINLFIPIRDALDFLNLEAK